MVAMTFRDRKRLIWLLNLTLAGGIIACLLCAIFLPLRVTVPEPASKGADPSEHGTAEAVKPLADYTAVSGRDLRRPLFDVDSASAVSRSADKPRLALKLVGTILESGRTCGLFVDRSGQTKFAKVGETLDGAEITAISDGTATVVYHGETITLDMPRKGGQP